MGSDAGFSFPEPPEPASRVQPARLACRAPLRSEDRATGVASEHIKKK